MRNSKNYCKQSLLLMIMLFAFSLTVNAKKKPKPVFKFKLEVTSTQSDRGKLIEFHGEAKEWDENWIRNFYIRNNTNERVYIEWENARLTGSRIIYGDDRRITMGNPKADEAVSAHGSSIMRQITGETYIGSEWVIPLFRTKDLKKNLSDKDYTFIMIPIRYLDNTVEEINLTLTVWYELPPSTE